MDTVNTAVDSYNETTKQVEKNKNLKDSPLLKGDLQAEIPMKQKRKRKNYQSEENIDFSVGLQEENTK